MQSAAIAFLLRGFNLATFDNFLEEPGWESPKAQANRTHLLGKRKSALDAYASGREAEWLGWIDALQIAIQATRTLTGIGAQEKAKRDRRKATNTANAMAERPNARTFDHDEIRAEFRRLVQEGHSEREASGLLAARGRHGSRKTIATALKDGRASLSARTMQSVLETRNPTSM